MLSAKHLRAADVGGGGTFAWDCQVCGLILRCVSNVETPCNCPQALFSLDLHCSRDVSLTKAMFLYPEQLANQCARWAAEFIRS